MAPNPMPIRAGKVVELLGQKKNRLPLRGGGRRRRFRFLRLDGTLILALESDLQGACKVTKK